MPRKSRLGLISTVTACAAIALTAVAPVTAKSNPDLASRVHFLPTKAAAAQATVQGDARSGGGHHGGGGGTTGTQAGINYHGGRVAASGFNVVSIYWSSTTIYPGGPTPGSTGVGTADGSLVGGFLRGLGNSPYYNINKTYWDNVTGSLRYVNGALNYASYWADNTNAPSGTQNVSDSAIQAEITAGFTNSEIAYKADTIYAVFSSGGVNLGGGAFSQYCAYHGNFTWNGNDVLYAVMPYNAYSSGCTAQATGPNNDPADFEVNTLAHEIEEANTDPDLNAWYDQRGYENADKCAWTFGTTSTASNGAKYNVTFGSTHYLIQRNWTNSGSGSCALS